MPSVIPSGLQQLLQQRTAPAAAPTPAKNTFLENQKRSVRYWRTAPKQPFEWPELAGGDYHLDHIAERPDFGVCVSGGGFRATTLASGWIRGLHSIKTPDGKPALAKARYLASNSGGSWFNGAFSFSKVSTDAFLGPVIEPGRLKTKNKGDSVGASDLEVDSAPTKGTYDCCIAARNPIDLFFYNKLRSDDISALAQKAVGLFTKADTNAGDEFAKVDAKNDPRAMPWTNAIKAAFLDPYGLADMSTTISAARTRGNVHENIISQVGNAKSVLLACHDDVRPYPVMIGAAINPPGFDGFDFCPVEFSPLYVGTPSFFYDSVPALGGGYFEPLGLNAAPQGGIAAATGTVEVDIKNAVPLATMVGISSSFFAAAAHAQSTSMQKLASTERMKYWGLISPAPSTAPDAVSLGFADGGVVDNLGLTALLRRGVKHIVCCVAADNPPDMGWAKWAIEACDVASYFGAAGGSWTPQLDTQELNSNNKVFGTNYMEGEQMFRELWEAFYKRLKTGKAPFVRAEYDVQPNVYQGIAGGYKVEILWIMNQQAQEFEKQLPTGTRTKLEEERKFEVAPNGVVPRPKGYVDQLWDAGWGRTNTLFRYPYFSTLSMDYGNAEVNLMSQQASWTVQQASDEILAMIERASK